MRLGLELGYLTKGSPDPVALAERAEAAGFDSVWVSEAWGSDGVSLLAWIGARTERVALGTAILPIGSRTPALLAQTAATLDMLSGGRLILGLGVSGPQVMEGWHGVPFAKPVTRTRETVDVIRQILRRETKLEYGGESIRLPLPGGTGLGKPLKLMLRPRRAGIPIYVASIGPQNAALTAEIADGWLPFLYSPDRAAEVWGPALAAGAAKRGLAAPLDVAPMVDCALGDDLSRLRDQLRPGIALYVGGMGARNATSTTGSRAATATRPPRRRSRTCIWTDARTRRRRRFRMGSWMRSASSGRRRGSPSGSPPTGKRASRP